MKKLFTPVALLAFVLFSAGLLTAQQSQEDGKFLKTIETYLDEMWKFYPTSATLAGYYKYNDKLEDFSESAIDKHLEAMDRFNAELVNKIAKDKLSPQSQIDLDQLRDALDLALLRIEKIAPQQLNPLYYNDIILQSIQGLLAKEFAPIDARLKSATERAKALPGFLRQTKENLKTPPKEYTEAAIKQFPAILNFYKTEVPKLIDNGSADAKAKFQAELAKAIPALEDYGKYLQGDLLAKSTGNFRLGEAHQRLIQLTCQGTLTLNELLARAKADTTNIRREMFKVCFPYYKIMDPKFDIEHPPANVSEDQLLNNVIPHVLNKIKDAQPAKDEWFNKIKATIENIKAFIANTKLLETPEDTLEIESMPAWERDNMLAKLVTPRPYEASGAYTVQINPYADTLPADQAQAFMDEYTNNLLPIWTIEKVYPGAFFPAALTRKNASLIQRLYPNQSLLQGWSLYAQDMFVYAGYNNYDLKMRLNELKLKLRALIDFQLDVNIHEGGLTKENAIRLMTVTGFQTAAEAERNWNIFVLNPGEATYAYVGYQEILDIEAEYKKAKAESFSRKEFLQKLLSYGALPLRNLKAKMVQ